MSRCDAEMCLHWDGHGCPCDEFGIERPGPGADPFGQRSATYERVEEVDPDMLPCSACLTSGHECQWHLDSCCDKCNAAPGGLHQGDGGEPK